MGKTNQDKAKRRKCAHCGQELQIGDDVLVLERAVLGLQQPIPLEEPSLFHCDDCFQEYVCNSESEKLPRRIP